MIVNSCNESWKFGTWISPNISSDFRIRWSRRTMPLKIVVVK